MNDKRTTRWHDKPNDEDTAVEIFCEQFPKPIARVLSYSSRAYGPGRHERDRYARLIAAAPELLAELKRMHEHFSAFASDHSLEASTETWAALHCAKAAIASAESSS